MFFAWCFSHIFTKTLQPQEKNIDSISKVEKIFFSIIYFSKLYQVKISVFHIKITE